MKKYLCGLAVLAAVSAPVSAEELYVRNRAFGDALFVAGTTYVPASSFLKALDVDWSDNGATVSLGSGDSPEAAFDSETITVTKGGKSLDLSGMVRGGKLYVPARDLAKFVGYTVINNPDTGIVDVVKTREITDSDLAAEKEVAASQTAAAEARKAEREARKAKEKAFADAKAEAEAKAKGETAEGEGETATEEEEGTETAADAKVEEAKPAEASPEAKPETPKEPPKANLVVLSSEATPNYYTGEVIFRAVIQNQGYAPAENLTAAFTGVGPDERAWVKKTLYHAPLGVDERWEIVETYKHPLQSAMPRGTFVVTATPKFTSAVVPETK